jgi:hypothetical protein
MLVGIQRVEPCGLKRQAWSFTLVVDHGADSDVQLRLDAWQRQERKTTRHKWVKVEEGWCRRNHNGHHHWGWRQPAADVPFPADVVEEAKAALLARTVIGGPVDPDPKYAARYG